MTRLALAGLVALGVAAWAGATLALPIAQLPQIDVSRAPGSQVQVSIAADRSGRILLAASNSLDPRAPDRGYRVMGYTSVDAGSTWSAFSPDGTSMERCSTADPASAVGVSGLELVAFVARLCSTPFDVASFGIDVVIRSRARGRWFRGSVVPIVPGYGNDKPAAAIDSELRSPYRGRIYIAWSRWHGRDVPIRIALSASDDAGRTWTAPRVVAGQHDAVSGFATVAIGPDGVVYLGWTDNRRRIFVERSTDGGRSFDTPVLVALAAGPPSTQCGFSGFEVRAQPRRCITTDPSITVGDRVFVTWTAPGRDPADRDVFVRTFSPALAPRTGAVSVTQPRISRSADQFLAASSFDRADRRLWVCFYDTTGDPGRVRARYSCTASRDGISWLPVSPVASVASDETADDALDPGYGDYEGVVAVRGVAHPIWADARNLRSLGEEIYATTLTADRLSRR